MMMCERRDQKFLCKKFHWQRFSFISQFPVRSKNQAFFFRLNRLILLLTSFPSVFIMQLSAALLTLLSQSTTAEPSAVAIGLQCANVSMDRLSDRAHLIVAQALQDAYPAQESDNFLDNVRFDRSHATKEDALKWNGTWNWGCRLCPNDDDVMSTAPMGAYMATLGGDVSPAGLHAWEATLTSVFRATGHPELKQARACQISMYDQKHEEEAVTPVSIGVSCGGVDVGALSAGVSTRALEVSYNKVHEAFNGGDNLLSGVHFDQMQSTKEAKLKWNGTWNWGCRLCPNDDDSMAGASTAPVTEFLGQIGCAFCDPEDNVLLTDDAALRAWEAEYTAALLETHSEVFANVHDCVIDIIPQAGGATSMA